MGAFDSRVVNGSIPLPPEYERIVRERFQDERLALVPISSGSMKYIECIPMSRYQPQGQNGGNRHVLTTTIKNAVLSNVPQELLSFAGIGDDVVVGGAGDHFVICSPTQFEKIWRVPDPDEQTCATIERFLR